MKSVKNDKMHVAENGYMHFLEVLHLRATSKKVKYTKKWVKYLKKL